MHLHFGNWILIIHVPLHLLNYFFLSKFYGAIFNTHTTFHVCSAKTFTYIPILLTNSSLIARSYKQTHSKWLNAPGIRQTSHKRNTKELSFYPLFVGSYLYSWFSLTWWDGHFGGQHNGRMLLKFCVITESNSQTTFLVVVLCTEHGRRDVMWQPRIDNSI